MERKREQRREGDVRLAGRLLEGQTLQRRIRDNAADKAMLVGALAAQREALIRRAQDPWGRRRMMQRQAAALGQGADQNAAKTPLGFSCAGRPGPDWVQGARQLPDTAVRGDACRKRKREKERMGERKNL